MDYKKLLGISMAVATIGTYTFNFSSFQSRNSLIKQGIDRIKSIAENYKKSLEDLQAEYDSLMNDLSNTQDALEQARIKLKQIYQKITGTEWDEANGDILDFNFDSLLKDSDQYDNNVDGDAIGAILGLPSGCSTQDIIDAINDLIATVQSLEARIQVLEGQVTDLQAEISTYETEQDSLVEEINSLKAKLDNATAEANGIIDGASQEEQAQLDYINNTLTELGGETITDDSSEPSEPETPVRDEAAYQEAYNNLSSSKLKTIVDAGYKPEYLGNYVTNTYNGYVITDEAFKAEMVALGYTGVVKQDTLLTISKEQKTELDAFYNEWLAN